MLIQTLLFLAPALVLAPLQESPEALSPQSAAQARTAEPRELHPELLSEPLELALVDILQVEAQLDDLSQPIENDGQVTESKADYQERLFGEHGALKQYLNENLARFDLFGQEIPGPLFVANLVRYDAGYAAATALVQDENFHPSELLALYSGDFFRADPIWNTEEAQRYRQSEGVIGDLAPLTNGSALSYLTFGILLQDEYWQAKEHDKPGFIGQLLAKGFEGRLVARAVRKAVEPPLRKPRPETGKQARGIAGPLVDFKSRIGFKLTHEDQLMGDLETLQAIKDLEGDDPSLDTGPGDVRPDELGNLKFQRSRLGYLKSWLPMMLQLVRDELYPGGAPELMRHGGTLEERLAYWRDFLNRYGFVAGRERILEEISAILAGQDAHPLSAEIEALLAKEAAGTLSESEEAKLEELQTERRIERDTVIRSIVSMLAAVGYQDHYDLLVETLAEDLPAITEGVSEMSAFNYFVGAWHRVADGPPSKVETTIGDYLDGKLELADYASDGLIVYFALYHPDDCVPALTRVLEEGPTLARCSALVAGEWVPAPLLKSTAADLLDIYSAPGTSSEIRKNIAFGLGQGIRDQEDLGASREILLATINMGLWSPTAPDSASWYSSAVSKYAPDDYKAQYREWFHTMLDGDEIKALEEAGKLPKGIF